MGSQEIGFWPLDFLKTAHEISMIPLWPHYVHMVPPVGLLQISLNSMCAQVAHIVILLTLSVPHENHYSFLMRPLTLSVGLLKTREILLRIYAHHRIHDRTYGFQ